ncbi:protein phosphatase 1 regulatory subunit 12C-like isoform X2 [Sinocyclocheilus anshuiensis]|uniref:protein phosphatase 1 regulatory subunit 12C-like isoform X2 n=1 Tax=Sinocyclocheilus anshuiensis TaxID=1608454 RepID=UPI0007B7F011|nr:PREDICTED: protein phosphatase 1 regulatory subunit 12C-like isoform X2 [Sinocyclocheilus anshuiensis]
MGDAAVAKRREQLTRWSGSSTDREPAVPRSRWRGKTSTGASDGGRTDTNEQQKKNRWQVRFEKTAEFLAVCASGDTEEAKEMLREARVQNGEDDMVNCANTDGITALHQACIDGSMEMVEFLLSRGANVNHVDSEGWTPLHVAASCGNLEITEFLLRHGASLCSVNCDGDVPMDIAEDEATETLLQEHTLTPDVEAAKRAEEEWIMRDARHWLTNGLPANLCHPRTGATPLHVAAAKGYLEAIKLLCQCGLDVSAKDYDGWTPLHAAAHWGQSEACRLLAEQLCDMEAHSNGGQTPFNVADESVASLLEELSQRQANWRTEQALIEQQNSQISNANTANKKHRSSVCRMSSRDKINVQDQSKERGVSGGLGLNDERESSSESSTVSTPESIVPSSGTIEDKEVKVNDQDRASRTAVVQPTPQRRESPAESPSNASSDGKKFQAPVRDEESEFQRKARSRLMRQSRRSTQGVTLTDLKEAERIIVKSNEPQHLSVQPVSPNITLTPAERDIENFLSALDTEPVKELGDAETTLGVRDRRKRRKESRSTGIVQLAGEMDANEDAEQDNRTSDPHLDYSRHSSLDYRKLYLQVLQENGDLKEKLQETQLQLNESKVQLEKLKQNQENGSDRPALLELERFEKKLLQRRASEIEDELKVLVDLRADNQRLKDENAALIRVISKLSK